MDPYHELDQDSERTLGCDVGFTTLLGARPLPLEASEVEGFRSRYPVIKRFQEACRDLFRRSLEGEEDPAIARMVVGELPEHLGADYHRSLHPNQDRTPLFFRTDESRSGRLSEIQCCGSGWGLVAQVQRLYAAHPEMFGAPGHALGSLPARFREAAEHAVGGEPVVHHLADNASRPHGVRYFVQRTREEGVRYFSYDRDVGPDDCNLVRAHDFISLPTHNFFAERMERCARGTFRFDLPPSSLYDGKIILAWPFWHRTRHAFDDEIRALFPYTTVIEPGGLELDDGAHATLEQFAAIPNRRRDWYLKYAGTDIGVNWGSKAVHLASTLSGRACRDLLDRIVEDGSRSRHWIAQRAVREPEVVDVLERDGSTRTVEAYGKLSGFYGPDGLMGVMGMHRHAPKVHGAADTVLASAW